MRVLLTTLALLVATAAWAASKQATAPEPDLEAMVAFEASTFEMGHPEQEPAPYGDTWYVDQVPAHEVTLSAYRLDRTEVTVEDFALFLTWAAGEYHFHADQPIERVEGGYLARPGAEQEPIRQVTWEAAHHYCLWAGKRLPTEAEWERAAAGADVREWPWEAEGGPNCRRAVYFTGQSYCADGPTQVGSHPEGATPEGVEDLAGNVAEWVFDRYDDYDEEPQTDPVGPDRGSARVIRGGGFLEWTQALRTRTRRSAQADTRSEDVGFRCAWSAPPEDGALRGELASPEDAGREPTDRPLAPPIEGPEVLAEDLTTPTRIVELAGALYVLDAAEGAVFALEEGALQPALLAEGFVGPADMVTDGEVLLVADRDAGEVWSLAPDGTLDLLADGQDGVRLLAADEGGAFWSCDAGLVGWEPVAGATVLVDGVTASGLALSATHLFWVASSGLEAMDELGSVSRTGGDAAALVNGFHASYDPVGLVRDEAAATNWVFVQKSSWPSNVEICEVPDGAAEAACVAYSPPKAVRPRLHDGVLYWATSYNVVAFDPAEDVTYRVVGTWADARDLAVTEAGVVWPDADNGKVYRR